MFNTLLLYIPAPLPNQKQNLINLAAFFVIFSHLFLLLFCFYHLQNYVQTISNLLKEEHRDKWEEAQLVSDKRAAVHHEWQVGEGEISLFL